MDHEAISPIAVHSGSCLIGGSGYGHAGTACNDISYIHSTPQLLFFGLADGQSGKRNGKEGGYACLRAAAQFLEKYGIPALEQDPNTLTSALMAQCRAAIHALARTSGDDFREYASTLIALAIDPESGQYLMLHLGDGCIIGVRRDTSLVMLSPPENGGSSRHTWLTTSAQADSHLRIGFGSARQLRRLVLLTDGVVSICKGKNISPAGKKLLMHPDRDLLLEFIRHANPEDDAGCVVVDVEQ